MLFLEIAIYFSKKRRCSRHASHFETENIKKTGTEGMKLNRINNCYCFVKVILKWSWLCKWSCDGGEYNDYEYRLITALIYVKAPALLPIITLAKSVKISTQWQRNMINWYIMKIVLTLESPWRGLGSASGPHAILLEPLLYSTK